MRRPAVPDAALTGAEKRNFLAFNSVTSNQVCFDKPFFAHIGSRPRRCEPSEPALRANANFDHLSSRLHSRFTQQDGATHQGARARPARQQVSMFMLHLSLNL